MIKKVQINKDKNSLKLITIPSLSRLRRRKDCITQQPDSLIGFIFHDMYEKISKYVTCGTISNI